MNEREKIVEIKEIRNVTLGNESKLKGNNRCALGVFGMLNAIVGMSSYDGYTIKTELHEYNILISNEQNCCETWGYFYLNDDEQEFVGANLIAVKVTDTALNIKKVEETAPYGFDGGGIQFVDFETDKGVLQFAVYNEHNGYYGHPIIFAKDEEILHSDTL